MNMNKENKPFSYEILIAFIGLVISLSALSEKFGQFIIYIGYYKLALGEYFSYALIGLFTSAYLYVSEWFKSIYYPQNFKFLNKILKPAAHFLFLFIIINPVVLLFIHFSSLVLMYINKVDEGTLNEISKYLTILQFTLLFVFTIFHSIIFLRKILESREKMRNKD